LNDAILEILFGCRTLNWDRAVNFAWGGHCEMVRSVVFETVNEILTSRSAFLCTLAGSVECVTAAAAVSAKDDVVWV